VRRARGGAGDEGSRADELEAAGAGQDGGSGGERAAADEPLAPGPRAIDAAPATSAPEPTIGSSRDRKASSIGG
jgi:hypothetical protein